MTTPLTPQEFVAAARAELGRATQSISRTWELRRRSAERALHDGAQQQLMRLRIDLGRAAEGGPDIAPADLDRRIRQIGDEIERLGSGRPPSVLDLGDLGAAITELAAGMPIPVAVDAPAGLLVDGVTAEVVAFAVSEALTNVLVHSGAVSCSIRLQHSPRELVLTVTDTGRGGAGFEGGTGLAGLAQRAIALGGSLLVDSGPAGTSVRLDVPVGRPLPPVESGAPETWEPSWGLPTRDHLRTMTGNPGLEVHFPVATGEFRDEQGAALSGPSTVIELAASEIAVRAEDSAELVAAGTGAKARLRKLVREGGSRAQAAVELQALRDARGRLDDVAQVFHRALAHRLTGTPLRHLQAAARRALAESGEWSARRGAAAIEIAAAAAAVRDVAGTLRKPGAQLGGAHQDPYLLGVAAEGRKIALDLRMDHVPLGDSGTVIVGIAEQLVESAPSGSRIAVEFGCDNGLLTLTATLPRLPEHPHLAALSAPVLSLGGGITTDVLGDRTLVRWDVPCGW